MRMKDVFLWMQIMMLASINLSSRNQSLLVCGGDLVALKLIQSEQGKFRISSFDNFFWISSVENDIGRTCKKLQHMQKMVPVLEPFMGEIDWKPVLVCIKSAK
uniref:Uncharacterized protein n=1 Tax=Spongospora subterranea TaxID=70186 RepID=A0A0H5QQZ1_9EUKA|eukprot:CRZ03896.1 hypothetical protein [Spongospora subterranea]